MEPLNIRTKSKVYNTRFQSLHFEYQTSITTYRQIKSIIDLTYIINLYIYIHLLYGFKINVMGEVVHFSAIN